MNIILLALGFALGYMMACNIYRHQTWKALDRYFEYLNERLRAKLDQDEMDKVAEAFQEAERKFSGER